MDKIWAEFYRMFCEWPMGTLLASLVLAIFFALIIALIIIAFKFLDSVAVAGCKGRAPVNGKEFVPEHYSTVLEYNVALKMSIPRRVHHSDEWYLTVCIDGQQCQVPVIKLVFDTVKINDRVTVEYVKGRFSGSVYVKNLSL